MDRDNTWTLIYQGTDMRCKLLQMQLDSATISTMIKSPYQSSLLAGFGTVKLTQLYVHTYQVAHASIIVHYFEQKLKNALN